MKVGEIFFPATFNVRPGASAVGPAPTITVEPSGLVRQPAPRREGLSDDVLEAMSWLEQTFTSPRPITDVLKFWDAPLKQQGGFEGMAHQLQARHEVLFTARRQLGVEAYAGEDERQWWRLPAAAAPASPDHEVEKWKGWKRDPLLIRSKVLGADVWVVKDEAAARTVEEDGRPIYFAEEFAVRQTKTPEEIRDIHKVKLAFPGCRIVKSGG